MVNMNCRCIVRYENWKSQFGQVLFRQILTLSFHPMQLVWMRSGNFLKFRRSVLVLLFGYM